MIDHLSQLLKKMGVLKYEDLNAEEKETYRQWEIALQGRKITDEECRKFLEMELDSAIGRLTDIDLSKEAEIFRKVEVRFIKKVLVFLNMPAVEKQMLQKHLESQIK